MTTDTMWCGFKEIVLARSRSSLDHQYLADIRAHSIFEYPIERENPTPPIDG